MPPRLWLLNGLGLLLLAGAAGWAWRQGGEHEASPAAHAKPLPAGESAPLAARAAPPTGLNPPADLTDAEPADDLAGEEQLPPGPVSALPPGGMPERPPHIGDWPTDEVLKRQQQGR